MTIDGLSLAASRAAAASALAGYRGALALDLALRAAAGLAALFAPGLLAGLLDLPVPSPTGWTRAWGALMLVIAALLLGGWFLPVRVRGPNAIGIGARGVLAVVYLCLGGFLWLALYEAASAALLFWLYFRLFKREIMTRP